MPRFVILYNWTEKGAAAVQDSPARGDAFVASARKAGVKVETMLWTVGPYDGLAIVDAPDEESVSALMLAAAKLGNIRTITMRGHNEDEFRKILSKLG